MNLEMSQIALNNGITFLTVSTGIVVLVVAGFIIKLIIDISKLTKNLTETTELINTELKPTLKEVNETLRSVNSLIHNTGEGVGNVKASLEEAFEKTKLFSKNVFGTFIKGFLTVYSLFNRKK